MPPDPAFPIAEGDRELVLHARLTIDGTELLCADTSEKSSASGNMYITLTTSDAVLVRKAWDALKDGGEVYMDIASSFFARLHGSLRDRFGINWMFTVSG
jgi:PhnB protein